MSKIMEPEQAARNGVVFLVPLVEPLAERLALSWGVRSAELELVLGDGLDQLGLATYTTGIHGRCTSCGSRPGGRPSRQGFLLVYPPIVR